MGRQDDVRRTPEALVQHLVWGCVLCVVLCVLIRQKKKGVAGRSEGENERM